MSEANDITARLLIEIPKRFPGARVWRNNRVDVMVAGRGGKPRRVMAGIDGQADITGVWPVAVPSKPFDRLVGFRLEIEVKAGRDKQSAEQVAFQEMVKKAGGLYLVARSVEQCLEELGRCTS